jgi:hypothetical protein
LGHRSIANTVVNTAVADKRIRNIWESEMINWSGLPDELQTYRAWFVGFYLREPDSLYELADFLGDERDRGQFPDARAIDAIYGLAEQQGKRSVALDRKTFDEVVSQQPGLARFLGERPL